MAHGPIAPFLPAAMLAAWPLLRPPHIDDPASQHGKAPLLFIAQARPEGKRGVCKAHVRSPAGGVRLAMAAQAIDQIDRRASLPLLASDLHLNLGPLTGSSLNRGPKRLLIRRQPQPRMNGGQASVQKGGAVIP